MRHRSIYRAALFFLVLFGAALLDAGTGDRAALTSVKPIPPAGLTPKAMKPAFESTFPWQTMAAGGSIRTMEDIILGVTIGQTASGLSTLGSYNLHGGFWQDFGPDKPNDLLSDSALLPMKFSLQQNHPNPFNPATMIEFSLPRKGKVELSIYNLLGQRVRVLMVESKPAGMYSAVWDGRDANGREVASGIYFYRLRAGENLATKKMLLLK